MGDGVLVCDQDGSIVLTNPATNRMLRLSGDDLLGKLLTEAHLPPELASAIDKSLKTKESAFTSISQELSLGGLEEVCLRAHTAPVRNDVGEIMGAVTVLQDISYLKETR